ncbi:MAG: hypothetical protein HQL99_15880 [Magnetococcales bacterium]|nr:hypothetical protein [Magnetococcales bacterium]
MSDHTTEELKRLAAEQISVGHMDQDRLNAMKDLILADGAIDDDEVAILRDMVLKTRPGTSRAVLRSEIELLFALNEGTIGHRNDETWKSFFISAVAAHVFQDESSEEVIDEKEAIWLISMIERDKQYDPNEIALLEYLQDHASDIPTSVKFRLGMILALT